MDVRVIKIFLLLLGCIGIQAQNISWLIADSTSHNMRMVHAEEVGDEIYFLANQEFRNEIPRYKSFIFKTNIYGDTLALKEITVGEYDFEQFRLINYIEETDIFIVQGELTSGETIEDSVQWATLILDGSLNELSLETFVLNKFLIVESVSATVVPTGLVTSSHLRPITNIHIRHGVDGEVVYERENNNRAFPVQSTTTDNNGNVVLLGDSVFIYNHSNELIDQFYPPFGSAKIIGQKIIRMDEFYYLGYKGSSSSVTGNQDYFVLKLDENFDPIEIVVYEMLSEVGLVTEGIDIKDGYLFNAVQSFPGLPGGSWWTYFKLQKTDLDLNEQWMLYYDEDLFYKLYGLLATDDGGVIVYGNHEDLYNVKDHPFIIKFDQNGNITTSTDQSINHRTIKILQNPSEGMFRLHLNGYEDKQLRIQMTDMAGKVAFSEDILGNEFEKDCTLLPSGMYVFSIIEDGKVRLSDQWIKR